MARGQGRMMPAAEVKTGDQWVRSDGTKRLVTQARTRFGQVELTVGPHMSMRTAPTTLVRVVRSTRTETDEVTDPEMVHTTESAPVKRTRKKVSPALFVVPNRKEGK